MRTIFLPRQGIDEPKDVPYRKFKAAISMAELEKQNAINHVELNEACAYGYDEDGTKRFQEMCLIISSDSDQYSGICNNLKNNTLLGTHWTIQKPQLLHIMYCIATRNWHHHAKYTRHLQQLHYSKVALQRKIRKTREWWKILSKSYMLSLPGDRTLWGKSPIINIQHPHWDTVTTSGPHHEPNHKGGTNN